MEQMIAGYILFRIVRKFIVKDLIVQIYNFKVFASNKKNKTSNALLRKCHFDDQAEMYANGEFRDVLFYRNDIEANLEREYRPGE